MNPDDRQRIIDRYNRRLDQHGVSIEALASGTEERRALRFDVLCGAGIAPGDSVLDLGCGFGDFRQYCRTRGLDIGYTGVDINERLVEAARERFPDATFLACDIESADIAPHDWVVSSSAFNLKLREQDNYEFAASILRRCHALARKGVAVDFLTEYVDFRGSEDAFYYSPEKMFTIAKSITRRVALRHDYPLFEFCVYLYPDFEGWGRRP